MQPGIELEFFYLDVSEAHVSRHNVRPKRGAPQNPQCNIFVMIEEFQGALYWVPLMPKGTSLSKSCTADLDWV